MPQPFDYNSILAQQPSGGMVDVARNAIFGQQQIQQNDNALQQQQMQLNTAKAQQMWAGLVSDPRVDDAQFEELIRPIAQLDPATAAKIRAERARAKDQGDLYRRMVSEPSAQNIFGYMAKFPEISEGVKRAYDVLQPAQQQAELRTMTDVAAALNNGKTDVARQILSTRAESDKAAGIDTSHYDQLAKLLDEDPAHSKSLANLALASVLGKDKFAEAFPALSKLPGEVAKGAAEAQSAQAEADAKPKVIESDLATAAATRQKMAADIAKGIADTQIAKGRLALDQDALTSNIQLKLQEMAQNGVKPDPATLGIINQSAGAAVAADSLAAREADLAARVRSGGQWSGPFASAAEGLKSLTGEQNIYTQLRAEWTQLKNSQALANRKDMPGAMSDADREFLLKGFPPDNASPEYIAHFLETMAMAQKAVAISEDRKASWGAANGNLGPAKNDISIKGVMVPRGTTFAEFMRSANSNDRKGALPTDIGELARKYGGKK